MSIIVLRYARRRMRIVSQGRLTLDVTPRYAVTSLRITLSRDFSPERHPAIRYIHVKRNQAQIKMRNLSKRLHSLSSRQLHLQINADN